jgi:hypothetical protein
MRTIALPHWMPPKILSRSLTAQGSSPKSPFLDVENESPNSGMTDFWHDVAVPFAAISVDHGARAPPVYLIVQLSMSGCDPSAPLSYRSPVCKFSESLSVPFRSRSNA